MKTPAARTPAASETNFGAVELVFPESEKQNLKCQSTLLRIREACLHKGLFHVRVPFLKNQAAISRTSSSVFRQGHIGKHDAESLISDRLCQLQVPTSR